jgi:hypothetical protein
VVFVKHFNKLIQENDSTLAMLSVKTAILCNDITIFGKMYVITPAAILAIKDFSHWSEVDNFAIFKIFVG